MFKRAMQFTRDFVNWIVPVLVLVAGVFVFNLPLLLSLVLAVLVFAGFFFVLNPKTGAEESKEAERDQVVQVLNESRAQVGRIRALSNQIPKQTVRDQVGKICQLADNTIADMLSKPDVSLLTASRFSSTFTQTLDILQLYIGLANGKVQTDPAKREELLGKIETDLLNQLQSSLQDFAAKLDQGQIVTLEATLRVLQTTLKLEGLS